MARLSASVRAASSSSRVRSPTASTTASTVAGSSRSRRVASSDRSRWLRTRLTRMSTSSGANPRRRPMSRHDLDAGVGVVPGKALADVVEQGAHEQEIGTADGRGQGGGFGRRLQEVPVDGEAVEGVALGPVAHGRPLGDEPARAGPAGRGLRGRRWPGARRPAPGPVPAASRRATAWAGPGECSARMSRVAPGDGQLPFGGHGGDPQGQAGVAVDVGVGAEDDRLALLGRPSAAPASATPGSTGRGGSSPPGPSPPPRRPPRRRRRPPRGVLHRVRRRQTSSATQATVRPASAMAPMRASASA